MDALTNDLVWSFSRMRMFDSCRRRYYYHHYLKWDGWNSDATPEQQQAYRLSKIKSLEILSGDLVHQGIEDVLRRFRNNNVVMSPAESLQTARLRWNKALNDSFCRLYERDPKSHTCLLEDYYKYDGLQEKAFRCWARLESCLQNFHASRTWEELRGSRPRHWLAMDGDMFKPAIIDGIPLHARPDLGYAVTKEGGVKHRCWVFDWKTGKFRDSDILQLRYYVLYAQHVWGFEPEQIRARLVYLDSDVIEEDVEIDADALADARRVLKESHEQMRSVLAEADANTPLDRTYFPLTERPVLCHHCSFQEICDDREWITPYKA